MLYRTRSTLNNNARWRSFKIQGGAGDEEEQERRRAGEVKEVVGRSEGRQGGRMQRGPILEHTGNQASKNKNSTSKENNFPWPRQLEQES